MGEHIRSSPSLPVYLTLFLNAKKRNIAKFALFLKIKLKVYYNVGHCFIPILMI